MGFLPWQRPGFDLGAEARRARRAPIRRCKGAVLGGHGLFTWGPDVEGLL